MKIRIKGNSVRYRLTRSEIATLWAEGSLEEQCQFAGKALVYGIGIIDGDYDKLFIYFVDDKICLRMPRAMIDELYTTGKVGFEGRTDAVNLLVEKDFVCIDNGDEDQSDHYPNPLLTCNQEKKSHAGESGA